VARKLSVKHLTTGGIVAGLLAGIATHAILTAAGA